MGVETPNTNTELAPPGWYPGPDGQPRWWDGHQLVPVTLKNSRPFGWSLAALLVGVAAFLTGLLPFVGLFVGASGVALGVIALLNKNRKAIAVIGICLGTAAVGASFLSTVWFSSALNAPPVAEDGYIPPAVSEDSYVPEEPPVEPADDTTIVVGQPFDLDRTTAVVQGVTTDVTCKRDSWGPTYGTLVKVTLTIDATDRSSPMGVLLDWKVLAQDGTTTNDGGRSTAAALCLDRSEEIPGYIENGNKYSGSQVLEVPPGATAILIGDKTLPLAP